MQAIILAAGFGKRLRPLTDTVPKAFTKVNGISLIENALQHLAQNGVSEVVIVIGHKKEVFTSRLGATYEGMKLVFVENPIYETTNNVYSLYLTKPYIHDDVLLLECDLMYDREVIDCIAAGEAECSILVSPYNKDTMDGTVIETVDGSNADRLTIKKAQGDNYCYDNSYKTVNIYKFKESFFTGTFMNALTYYVENESKNSYYELVLGSLIYYGNHDIRIVPIEESTWCEIDTVEDLRRAEEQFEGHQIRELAK